jgi:excisionase family DNA binding protein
MRKRRDLPLPPADKLRLSINEACALSGLGESTLRLHCKKGKLRHKRVGRRIIIRRVDLERFLDPELVA